MKWISNFKYKLFWEMCSRSCCGFRIPYCYRSSQCDHHVMVRNVAVWSTLFWQNSGRGVTESIPFVPFFPFFWTVITLATYWITRTCLTGVTAVELRPHLWDRNVIDWHCQRFINGETNERVNITPALIPLVGVKCGVCSDLLYYMLGLTLSSFGWIEVSQESGLV